MKLARPLIQNRADLSKSDLQETVAWGHHELVEPILSEGAGVNELDFYVPKLESETIDSHVW